MKILNLGSLNIDKVYSVPHFAQPEETISSSGFAEFPGGKGLNQSIALARAGSQVYHAGKIGPDGLLLKETLLQAGVNTDLILQTGSVTGQAIIQVNASGENCIILLGGANEEIYASDIDRILKDFHEGDLLLLQNELSCTDYAIQAGHAKGIIIAFNPSPIKDNLKKINFAYIDYLMLNEVEGESLSGETDPDTITQHLLRSYPNLKIVLTLGKKGVIYLDAVSRYYQDAFKANVVDTTAAGDTFTGYFFSRLFNGEEIPAALEAAAKAAAITVSRKGASSSIPRAHEVL